MPGVQHLARGQIAHGRGRIQLVAQRGWPRWAKMHAADLMGAPGMDAHGQRKPVDPAYSRPLQVVCAGLPPRVSGSTAILILAVGWRPRARGIPLFQAAGRYWGQIFLAHLAPGKSRARGQARGFGQGHQQRPLVSLSRRWTDNAGAQAFQSAQLERPSRRCTGVCSGQEGQGCTVSPAGACCNHQAFVLPEQFKMSFLPGLSAFSVGGNSSTR